MQIQAKLYGVVRNFFVGREKELEILRKHAAGHSDCQWLHIYATERYRKINTSPAIHG